MAQPLRIVAIAQVYNELQRGNLRRFVDHLKPLVGEMIIYDNGSSDGSWQYLKTVTPHLLRGYQNDFLQERRIRERLLKTALTLKPDFILWLDADEVLTANAATELQATAQWTINNNYDGVALHELNLWRSNSWRRTDNAYDDGWFVRLWRVTPKLHFSKSESGLHRQLYPESIQRIGRAEKLAVLHYGFSTDDSILFKYLNYRRHGQSGWPLERLIDESTLTVEKVPLDLIPTDVRGDDTQPNAQPLTWWQQQANSQESRLLRPTVSVVALIYKSTQWLKFSYEQILKYTNLRDVEILFVANDAADHVRKYLRDHYIPHVVFDNTPADREEWYINNVYRAWNYGARMAKGEFVLFVNSDMAFTPDWIEKLLQRMDGHHTVAARLIESGKMRSGLHGIEKNFGQTLETFDEAAFQKYAQAISVDEMHDSGLFMPLLIRRDDFLAVGGYPKGNIVPGSDLFHPDIAKQAEPMTSGDVVLMAKLKQHQVVHQTDFNTISYHFQEGEMDDARHPMNHQPEPVIAIVNDWLTGRMGEQTMWNVFVEKLPNVIGIDQEVIGESPNFSQRARHWLDRRHSRTHVIIQNASFIDTVDTQRWTIAFLQDDLRRMGNPSEQQERNLKTAKTHVTNSWLTARSYPEYNFNVIPLGVDEQLFRPMDQVAIRNELKLPSKATVIFVGDLSPVKGWAEVKQLIHQQTDLHWIIVSKKPETFSAPNVTMFNRVDQTTLAKLYNAADVFLVGSPVETQCLAAIEAGFCGKPIVMHVTGIFWEMSDTQRSPIGWFGDNLANGLDQVFKTLTTFQPREALIAYGLTNQAMIGRWQTLLTSVVSQVNQIAIREGQIPALRKIYVRSLLVLRTIQHFLIKVMKVVLKAILPRRLIDRLYAIVYKPR